VTQHLCEILTRSSLRGVEYRALFLTTIWIYVGNATRRAMCYGTVTGNIYYILYRTATFPMTLSDL